MIIRSFTIPHPRALVSSLVILIGLGLFSNMALSVEEAFPPTPSGHIEIKELPAGILIESTSDRSYFSANNRLFGPLFRYISDRNIAMTTPVEARIDPGKMYFWIRKDEVHKVDGDTNNVRVIEMPPRLVASAGARGAYSETNFIRTRERLLEWLTEQEEWEAVGEPFAVYWNGPFTVWFLKRFEVQIEVARRG